MTNIVGLALYGPLAASHRYRLAQYVPAFEGAGIRMEMRSLLDDDYLRSRFTGRSVSWGQVLYSGWQRAMDLLGGQDCDGLMLYGELFPLMPAWFEQALMRKPYIYDFDDAFFLKYRHGRLRLARPWLGNKFEQLIAGAVAVTAGNTYLADFSREYNVNTHLMPTVVDTMRYTLRPFERNECFTVGWIGSPTTAPFLNALVEPLSRLGQEQPLRLVVVGGKAPAIPNVTIEEVTWDEATEIEQIQRFDVGVMPLPDDPWARGKCAFKLIQYMACGIPVVASPVGANLDVVTPDCGFLADGAPDWVWALRQLRDAPALREHMGTCARIRIEQQYALNVTAPQLVSIVRQVFG